MLSCLQKHGFRREYLLRNLISFAADGALNILERKNGFTALLVEMFSDILVWHCCNHRLEFAVNYVVRKINENDHMKRFFDELYSLYSASPRNQYGLRECGRSLSL
jgi:hypothetical protein